MDLKIYKNEINKQIFFDFLHDKVIGKLISKIISLNLIFGIHIV